MKVSRADRSAISHWWFTVDKQLLTAVLVLMLAGVLLSLATGPIAAAKKGLATYYFVERHLLITLLAVCVMVLTSHLTITGVRRISLIVLALSLLLMGIAIVFGTEINGARRWVFMFGQSLQPSELAKPTFIVVSAWLFSERAKHTDRPAVPIALLLFGLMVGLLVLQPDIGHALLISIVWAVLIFSSGLSLLWVAGVMAATAIVLGLAYGFFPHVRGRIDRFFDPASGDTYQLDRAQQSFLEGGWFGRGPGEGTIKSVLPDAHTDFVLSVIAEEFGIITCLVLLGLFAFVVLRALALVWTERDAFVRSATTGLAVLLGVQTAINMGVNVGLLPAKGMTLPFISYGGSSLLGMSLAMGMILALCRWRYRLTNMEASVFAGTDHKLAELRPGHGSANG